MKTTPMLVISLGLLLGSSALAQIHSLGPDWQSMRIDQTTEPSFPHQLIVRGVTTGAAQIAIYVDASGQLAEWLVVKYTQPEFAESAVAAVKQWKFEPARMKGEPIGITLELVFNFEARGVVVSSSTTGDAAERLAMNLRSGSFVYRPCAGGQLDRAPEPTVKVAPQYSKALAAKGVKGDVTVEYYIDETGAVRMPCVSAEDDPMLGALTIAAVSQWKFSPPTSHGRGVLVKATQVFTFKGDNS